MSDSNKLQLIPLGGLGEFGMNMLALRCGEDILVIDAGILFPGADLLGVDVVVPDIAYLTENAGKIRGLVLTHGHEDHIGAVPYVLSQIQPPIYLTAFTQALVERRLQEHTLDTEPDFHGVQPGDKVELGCFTIEFIHVTHSTVDCVMLAIETPLGVVIHTADFKVDQTPIDGELFDLHTLADYGKRGVLLLLADSTNVDRPGFTPSELAVRPALEDIFTRAEGALYVSCFSSSTPRVQQILDVAEEFDRKVAFVGRSVASASELAQGLGLLEVPPGLLMKPQDLAKLPLGDRCFIISGTQGEPLSSLSRAALGRHRHASIQPGDTVIISARLIPGNEKNVYRMVDHLYRRGAEVYQGSQTPPLHVSGHASEEELKLMLNLVRPKYFIPVHGEYRMLARHASLAHQVLGDDLTGSFVMQSGDVLEIDAEGARMAGPVPVGRIFIDAGTGDEITEEMVIRDRRHLSEFGVVLPIVAINHRTGEVETGPEIITRGLVLVEDSEEFLEGARKTVIETIENSSEEERTDVGVMEEKIRNDLRRYFSRETSRGNRPLIVPVILED